MRNAKDPTNPTDILDRPIQAGDYVAYPAMAGRSARMTVGQITSINFKIPKMGVRYDGTPYETSEFVNAPTGLEHTAKKYTVSIQPIVSTSYYWTAKDGKKPKPVTIQNVENILLVSDLPCIEQKLSW